MEPLLVWESRDLASSLYCAGLARRWISCMRGESRYCSGVSRAIVPAACSMEADDCESVLLGMVNVYPPGPVPTDDRVRKTLRVEAMDRGDVIFSPLTQGATDEDASPPSRCAARIVISTYIEAGQRLCPRTA